MKPDFPEYKDTDWVKAAELPNIQPETNIFNILTKKVAPQTGILNKVLT